MSCPASLETSFNRNRAGSVLGDLKDGTFQAGQSSGLVADIVPVRKLVPQLIDEYNAARNSLAIL